MRQHPSKLIGTAIAGGLLLNAIVGLASLCRPVHARAAAPQAVYLTDEQGKPLALRGGWEGVVARLQVEVVP